MLIFSYSKRRDKTNIISTKIIVSNEVMHILQKYHKLSEYKERYKVEILADDSVLIKSKKLEKKYWYLFENKRQIKRLFICYRRNFEWATKNPKKMNIKYNKKLIIIKIT